MDVATKSGVRRLEAAVVIDASGDADVCALAGAPFEPPGEGVQSLSTVFRMANVDMARAEAVPKQELWERMLHSLSHQGIDKEAYLRIAGRDEADILEEAKPDAEQALRREAVIAAVVAAEGIEATEGDVLDALTTTAARERTTPEKLRARLEKAGRLDDLREDLAQRAAIDLLAENATPISVEQAQARDKLWTPGRQGNDDAPSRLWTPGARD